MLVVILILLAFIQCSTPFEIGNYSIPIPFMESEIEATSRMGQGNKFFTTYNDGACCAIDNFIHVVCFVSTGAANDVVLPDYYTIPGHEEGFEISECRTRCLNDQSCRGYSIFTTTDRNTPSGPTIRYDTCGLYTTSYATALCYNVTDHFWTNPNPLNPWLGQSKWSTGTLDPNAACIPEATESPEITFNYHDGCNIKKDQDIFGVNGENTRRLLEIIFGILDKNSDGMVGKEESGSASLDLNDINNLLNFFFETNEVPNIKIELLSLFPPPITEEQMAIIESVAVILGTLDRDGYVLIISEDDVKNITQTIIPFYFALLDSNDDGFLSIYDIKLSIQWEDINNILALFEPNKQIDLNQFLIPFGLDVNMDNKMNNLDFYLLSQYIHLPHNLRWLPRILKLIDQNQDGVYKSARLRQFVEKIWNILDANKDQNFSVEDVYRLLITKFSVSRDNVIVLQDYLDSVRAFIKAAFKKLMTVCLFNFVDINKDGEITLDELLSTFQVSMENRNAMQVEDDQLKNIFDDIARMSPINPGEPNDPINPGDQTGPNHPGDTDNEAVTSHPGDAMGNITLCELGNLTIPVMPSLLLQEDFFPLNPFVVNSHVNPWISRLIAFTLSSLDSASFYEAIKPCRFKDGDVRGKPERFIGRSGTEDGCSLMVQEKVPSAKGARWYKILNYCYAEFGNYIQPTRAHARSSRACLFGDFIDKVGVKYEKYPHTTCPEASGRNSAPGTRASCNIDLECYAYVDHGNGRGSKCTGITKADPSKNFEETPNSKDTLFIKA